MKRVFFLGLILAAVAAGYLWHNRPLSVSVVKPQRQEAIQAVYATGTVEPSVMFPIAPRMAGKLMSLQADEGQRVVKGQVLAQLEDTDLQKMLEQQKAKLDQAEKDYTRKAMLLKTNAVSPDAVEQALSVRDASRAAVEQINAQIGYMQLTAPADGELLRRDGEVGQLIPVNQPVFYMSCCAPLRIAADVDEEDISLVQPGLEVVISADAFPGKVYHGKVQSITPKGDPVARSFRTRIGLDGDTDLMIGMTAETNIIISKKQNALMLPVAAVKDGNVWLVGAGGSITEKPVKTGIKTIKAIEVTEGLADDDTVVADVSQPQPEGRRIRPQLDSWQAKQE